ncbi:efflux RND transporter periplasmic adaptor subunit [Marinilabilia rubra]|uniref:Efflux transporter periplasmic adaptor subunit n=1 Tax=Marinilabilia rubra TaxID=2162893 RepID=A0A2U2B9Q4_9BACT|nr:efflux RND transporter periplasmic adaptor subunit [Marinilabilia rubra]PWD99800.1 efflux transporter periplasmic adaptor subunit [Marinilabilia rubra]
MSKKKSLLISLSILLGAAIVVVIIFQTEPTAHREGATKETAMLVDVQTIQRGNYKPVIVTTGTVEPEREIMLSPRVAGEVINRSDKFDPGQTVQKNEFLLRLDPVDYEIALELRKSELQQAMADLEIEKGRQEIARRDFQQAGETLSPENQSLVLREPQQQTARARVAAGRSAVRQAEIDLQRTRITAPFDAQILSRNVDLGSQVARGEELGNLVGTERYWVVATVPQSRIPWLSFAEKEEEAAQVTIQNRNAWRENEYRKGFLYKMIGALENQTRMVRVLVAVPDPLNVSTSNPEGPDLLIGAFVEVRIKGEELEDVFKLNRDFVRKNQTVWVMENDTLAIKPVDIVLTDAEFAYISDGLEDNDQVVTTNLATVVEGSPLRLEE